MPFRAGEILNYRVAWAIFPNAAALQMNVVERRNLLGWQTWHFRASAHSQNPARTLFEVDDQFDSYTDTTTLESHQYELYLNEMGSQQNEVLHLIPVGQSARGAVAPVLVQPGTRDPLGAFYALRAVDWQRTPEFRVPVYDGSDLYEVRARQEAASEAVQAQLIAERIALNAREVGITVQVSLSGAEDIRLVRVTQPSSDPATSLGEAARQLGIPQPALPTPRGNPRLI